MTLSKKGRQMPRKPEHERASASPTQSAPQDSNSRPFRLEIEKFGKVVSSSIEDAPLTLLLGKNNTGKSYVATLIWALHNSSNFILTAFSQSGLPKWLRDFISAAVKTPGSTIDLVVDESKSKELVSRFNTALLHNGPTYFGSIFAFDGYKDAKVTVAAKTPHVDFKLSITNSSSSSPGF